MPSTTATIPTSAEVLAAAEHARECIARYVAAEATAVAAARGLVEMIDEGLSFPRLAIAVSNQIETLCGDLTGDSGLVLETPDHLAAADDLIDLIKLASKAGS